MTLMLVILNLCTCDSKLALGSLFVRISTTYFVEGEWIRNLFLDAKMRMSEWADLDGAAHITKTNK